LTFAVWGPITRSDLCGLSERVCALFAEHPDTLAFCDVAEVPCDAITVEALARLQLVARRNGITVRLRNASSELLALVAFLGLEDVLTE
jgi:ABC-type transporter Mla MlaB component